MRGHRPGALVCALTLLLAACSEQPPASSSAPARTASAEAPPPSDGAPATEMPPPPDEVAEAPSAAAPEPDAYPDIGDIEPGAGMPEPAGGSAPPPMSHGMGAPPPEPAPAAPYPMPPAAHDPYPTISGPSAMPPAAHDPYPTGSGPSAMPPGSAHSGSKVLSYFQKARTQLQMNRAFGFVLMPKAAVTDQDKRTQKDFCTTLLASMDFMTPGAVASSAPVDVLATYWPIVGSRESYEIKQAFTERNCDELIAWYDFALARTLASRAGVSDMSGPLLITWPAQGVDGQAARDPLIVDFSKADHERASKALQYWFRQVKARPALWTNRIREGTIRAELADAVNDTAGVMLLVMAGKWDSLTVVASAAPPP